SQCPRLKKRYQHRAERVKEYLESVKDFDELVSPQSLFLHVLGSGSSTKVQKNFEVVKKRMATRFSKQKLAEAQEKKAKGSTVSGLLSKKKTSDTSNKDSMVIPPPAHSPAKRPAFPTSSLKVIASGGEKVWKKKKVGGKSFLPTFWDDADAAALKSHEALSVENLSPLMAKSSKKKVATFEPVIKSLSVENEMFKNKVVILTVEAKNDKERVAVLEKSLQVEKDFYKLKDKQIGDLELKKWMVKHHLDLDLSGLVMDEIEKKLLADRPFEVTAENVIKEATDVAMVMEEAVITTLADPVLDEQ
ncbi:hypothetical protein SO802_015401, partial [Lithocarpus litseifolius]